MTNVVKLQNKRDWKYFDKRLTELRLNEVENILARGRVLIEAKEELEHGSWDATIRRHCSQQTAHKLMAIAQHSILSNHAHVRDLPPSWGTIYELTKLPNEILITKLKDGSIHPKLERKDVRAMRPDAKDKPKPPTREELIAAIQKDPMANQRDAAEALGVSLGVYQRTRNELIGSGQIKGDVPPTTIEPQAQRDEMRRSYVTFLVTLAKEDQVEEITKIIRRELGWTTKEISLFLSSNYPRTKFKI